MNGATCENSPNTAYDTPYTCVCPSSFSGAVCEVQDFCSVDPCPAGVPCINLQDTFECDHCATDVCLNGATCLPSTSSSLGYECQCREGFTDLDCSVNIDDCLPTSCDNGGTCIDQVNGFSCVCLEQFSGPTCQSSSSCDTLDCENGFCLVDDEGIDYCRCDLGFTGMLCQEGATTNVPHFLGTSYLKTSLPASMPVLNELYVKLEFIMENQGIILYAQQESGPGDFFSLSIQDSRLVFNFDLGSGVGSVTSDPILLEELVEVSIFRSGREGQMNVTGQSPKIGEAGGSLQSLNVGSEVFVGGYEDYSALPSVLGTGPGFAGCILSLVIQDQTYSFNPSDISELQNVAQCRRNVCQARPCLNNGTCQSQPGSAYSCQCDDGYHGDRCEERMDVCQTAGCSDGSSCVVTQDGFRCICPLGMMGILCDQDQDVSELTPSFRGTSYLGYLWPEGLSTQETRISLRIRPGSSGQNALILYVEDTSLAAGDFLALGIVEDAVELRFNLGSGTSTLTSDVITAEEWHVISIVRTQNTAQLIVDDNVVDHDGSGSVGLTVDSLLYVGGVPTRSFLHEDSMFDTGFFGCIENLKVGETSLYPSLATEGADIEQCEHSTCNSTVCLNGGTCQSIDAFTLECICPSGQSGARCEQAEIVTVPKFSGFSYLAVNISNRIQYLSSVTMEIRPDTDNDGIIYWNSAENDFMGIGLVDRRVQFTFDLGSGPATLVSNDQLDSGEWYTVRVSRRNGEGQLWLNDQESPVTGQSSGSSVGLSVGLTYIGGVASSVTVPARAGITGGFSGCIRSLTVNEEVIDLTENLAQSSVSQCNDELCNLDHGCQNEARCVFSSSSSTGYLCECAPGYSGDLCETSSCDLLSTNEQCQNDGLCYVSDSGQASCLCSVGFSGPICDQPSTYSIPMFGGNSYLSFERAILTSVFHATDIRLLFRAMDASSDSLLLWHGPSIQDSFITLGIKDGIITLLYNLGSGIGELRADEITIENFVWYNVEVTRRGASASLVVQSLNPVQSQSVTGSSPGSSTGLATFGSSVFLGGYSSDITQLTNGYFSSGFNGCIAQLLTSVNPSGNLQVVDLVESQRTGGAGIQNCDLGLNSS
ncbi:protein eyes shut homolog [Lytechinus variegatus]|uniref:protein eyes shut homolog n=1 Tax=Lytechinus variegatus TaxID=7654 RepID=UPI001BB21276|nr:protein eyes shut homolog [Lytechinus variegatus]